MAKIKFGTDGWRGIIAQDYTFDNVSKVALATARFYKKHKKARNGILIGYDTRFQSQEFAERAAQVIASTGLKVILSDGYCPTPALSLAIPKFGAAGGVVITASHNPARYNGFKLKADFGGPEEVEYVAKVEKDANRTSQKSIDSIKKSFDDLSKKGLISKENLRQIYIDDLKKKIDIETIKNAQLRIVHDAMYGAGQGILKHLIGDATVIHDEFNPSFGGEHPEPIAMHLGELLKFVPKGNYSVGLATDGDADRIGAVDENGNFVGPQEVYALLLKYYYETKGLRGEVVKTVSVGDMPDILAKKYNLTLTELPVGFKHVAAVMISRDVLIGGEESGGVGLKGHIPERDGLFLGLTICEMMAKRTKTLGELVKELFDQVGPHVYRRIDVRTTEQYKQRVLGKLKKGLKEVAGHKIDHVLKIDGYKYFFADGGWMLVRASGTEPLIRYYCEAESKEKVDKVLEAITHL
ncbi:MAG TPA: phosphoglucomutase/phosphomannomutase family protein [Candidatus Acidoferrales bacterium]|nr:phosphoglucomutase/phosphomannomutase family protein [Candidatus Acidoferrales bacterium]